MNESSQKSVLAIGGSYFLGRAFSIYASRRQDEFNLTVVNRGTYPIRLEGVTELICDRKDVSALKEVVGEKHFDVIVDFCAYSKGDVETIAQAGITCDQYILISTANVLSPVPAPPETLQPSAGRHFADRTLLSDDEIRGNASLPEEVKSYLIGKLAVEQEVRNLTTGAFTIVRPAFIYGPLDYSNRMGFYFTALHNDREMVFPSDSTARFSTMYVKDLANALLNLVGNKEAFNKSLIAADPEPLDWTAFENAFSSLTDQPQRHLHCPVSDIISSNIPIPFPLDTDESYCADEFVQIANPHFTPFSQGLMETWNFFKDIEP